MNNQKKLKNIALQDIFCNENSQELFDKEFKYNLKDIVQFIDYIDSLNKLKIDKIILTSFLGLFLITFLISSGVFGIKMDNWLDILMGSISFSLIAPLFIILFNNIENSIPSEKVSLLKNNRDYFTKQFIKKLKIKEFQAEILLYLNQLDNNKLNIDNKELIVYLKKDLMLNFHNNNFQEACDNIFIYAESLIEIEEKINILSEEEKQTNLYLKNLEKDTNIKINMHSVIEEHIKEESISDYRTIV